MGENGSFVVEFPKGHFVLFRGVLKAVVVVMVLSSRHRDSAVTKSLIGCSSSGEHVGNAGVADHRGGILLVLAGLGDAVVHFPGAAVVKLLEVLGFFFVLLLVAGTVTRIRPGNLDSSTAAATSTRKLREHQGGVVLLLEWRLREFGSCCCCGSGSMAPRMDEVRNE